MNRISEDGVGLLTAVSRKTQKDFITLSSPQTISLGMNSAKNFIVACSVGGFPPAFSANWILSEKLIKSS